eukprot:356000-Chlamydomonas_euryale.AAC.2
MDLHVIKERRTRSAKGVSKPHTICLKRMRHRLRASSGLYTHAHTHTCTHASTYTRRPRTPAQVLGRGYFVDRAFAGSAYQRLGAPPPRPLPGGDEAKAAGRPGQRLCRYLGGSRVHPKVRRVLSVWEAG